MIKIINNMPILCDELPNTDISDLLQLGKRLRVLINTHHMRGIGKTYSLIQFAKTYGYAVIEPTKMTAQTLIDRENFQDIYPSNIRSIKKIRPNGDIYFIKDIVLDEGVTNVQELKDAGFNIITGFYTFYKEDELCFKDKVMKTLVAEIEALTPKLQKTRENKDFGTYKNLINAYREILNLIQNHIKTFDIK